MKSQSHEYDLNEILRPEDANVLFYIMYYFNMSIDSSIFQDNFHKKNQK